MFKLSEFKKGDYLVVRDGTRNALVQLTSHAGKSMSGVLTKDRAYKPKNLEFELKQVVALLGPDPATGSVYGQKVIVHRGSSEVEGWGNIHYFRKMEKDERVALKGSLAKQLTLRKKLKLPPPEHVEAIEVHERSGKYAGRHMFRPKGKDIIQLAPTSFMTVDENSVIKGNRWSEYVICHEDAHNWWYRLCSDKVKARWVSLYHSTVKLHKSEQEEVKRVGKLFFNSKADMEDFRSTELDEDQATLFDASLVWIRNHHNLTLKHLKLLAEFERDTLKSMWPRDAIFDTDYEIPLGEYASTSPEETFAEAVAMHYAVGMKIPKEFLNLLLKTVSHIGGK